MYTIIPQTQTRPWERVCVCAYLLQCRRLAIHDIDGSDNKDKRLKSCTKFFTQLISLFTVLCTFDTASRPYPRCDNGADIFPSHVVGNGFIVGYHGLGILWRSVGISHQESTFFIRMQSTVDGIEADVFHKRMVITHRKDLCEGDYLIDDRGKHGTSEFGGEWIEYGSEKFPDWTSVLNYLLPQS